MLKLNEERIEMARSSSQAKESTPNETDLLKERIQQLEQAVCKLAVMSGHGNYLKEFGLKVWQPKREDMHRKFT